MNLIGGKGVDVAVTFRNGIATFKESQMERAKRAELRVIGDVDDYVARLYIK